MGGVESKPGPAIKVIVEFSRRGSGKWETATHLVGDKQYRGLFGEFMVAYKNNQIVQMRVIIVKEIPAGGDGTITSADVENTPRGIMCGSTTFVSGGRSTARLLSFELRSPVQTYDAWARLMCLLRDIYKFAGEPTLVEYHDEWMALIKGETVPGYVTAMQPTASNRAGRTFSDPVVKAIYNEGIRRY